MMNYKQMMTILDGDTDAQADTITVYVDGEYLPARLSWHENDVVALYVLEIDDVLLTRLIEYEARIKGE